MKILLIYFNTAARGAFPLGLSILANYIKKQGHDVRIFDTTFYEAFRMKKREILREKIGQYKEISNPIELKYSSSSIEDDLISEIQEFQPQIIGLSILSAHFHFSIELSKIIKEHFPGIPIIVGGLHPTILPEETINVNYFDMICVGEGEYALSELLKRIENDKDIIDVKGIWVKRNGAVYKNDIGKLTDINKIPINDWDLFSCQHLLAPLDGRLHRMGSVEFSRGCPYSCAYCSINYLRDLMKPQKYLRRKNVDRSIEELVYLKDKYRLEMFYFLDETFLSNDTSSLKLFAKEYRQNIGIPFHGLTHPLSVTEDKVKILKEMNCYLMTIGIEHGNESFRKNVLNRNVSNAQIIRSFELFEKYGIFASAFGMIGLPFETRGLVFDTIEMFRKCQPRTYSVGIYKPFPGSNLRSRCIKEGFLDPSNDDYKYPNETSVLNMPQFPKEEIEALYKTFYLYTKVPKNKFSLVKQAETDGKLLTKLVNDYRESE